MLLFVSISRGSGAFRQVLKLKSSIFVGLFVDHLIIGMHRVSINDCRVKPALETNIIMPTF
jgi:hypothetical protein